MVYIADNVDEGLYLAREAEIDPNGTRTLRAYTFWKQVLETVRERERERKRERERERVCV